MAHYISILLSLALVGILIYIIAENGHPVHTLAWVVAITFLPVIGLILYFLVGHRPRQRKLVEKEELSRFKQFTEERHKDFIAPVPAVCEGLSAMLQATNQAFPTSGNYIKTYYEFYPMLDDLVADLERAKDHIHFEFFKFEDDPSGRRVAEVLMRKASEGIAVRVQYDDLANLRRKRFFRMLRDAGVHVKPFLALTLPFVSQNINFRNHRKIVVIDGKIGYMGGMNIAERYGTGLGWGPWRDTHLRLTGPAVAELQTAFLCDWRFSTGELLAQERYYPACGKAGDALLQIISSGPMDEWNVAMQGFVRLVSNARRYVYVQSPYFIPTAPVMLALKNAALSGVDVRVMFPWRGDRGSLVSLASKSYVSEALASGVKIFFYRKGFLHAKTTVSDDTLAVVGSTNVDVRSYTLDFEIDAYIYDSATVLNLKEAFLRDQTDAWQADLQEWRNRSRFEKFKESLARLLSPLL